MDAIRALGEATVIEEEDWDDGTRLSWIASPFPLGRKPVKVLVPGHAYEFDNVDDATADVPMSRSRVNFVVRVGDKFPGNGQTSCSGTLSQEVIRALIDRAEYVNGQREHARNRLVLHHLREALRELEMRAAEERGDLQALSRVSRAERPELMPTCPGCGHVQCERSHES